MRLIVIVPFDLARDPRGQIVVGPETRIACDAAIDAAATSGLPIAEVTVTSMAGLSPANWDHVWMAEVIGSYVISASGQKVGFLAGKASSFNTYGEMEALADTIVAHQWLNPEITLVVKWWHAPRTLFLCRYWLRKKKVLAKVSVRKCRSNVRWHTILAEYIGAWPKNLLRICFCK